MAADFVFELDRVHVGQKVESTMVFVLSCRKLGFWRICLSNALLLRRVRVVIATSYFWTR